MKNKIEKFQNIDIDKKKNVENVDKEDGNKRRDENGPSGRKPF